MAIEITNIREATEDMILESVVDGIDADFSIEYMYIFNDGTTDFKTLEDIKADSLGGLELISDGEVFVKEDAFSGSGERILRLAVSKSFSSVVDFDRVYFSNRSDGEVMAFQVLPQSVSDVIIELDIKINTSSFVAV